MSLEQIMTEAPRFSDPTIDNEVNSLNYADVKEAEENEEKRCEFCNEIIPGEFCENCFTADEWDEFKSMKLW